MAGMSKAEIDGARHSGRCSRCWSGPTSCATAWSRAIPATYLQLVRTAWTYIAIGALWRLMRLRKGPVIAALYPVGMLLVQLLLAIAGRARFVVWGWLGAV